MRIGFCADVHIANHGVMGGPVHCGMNRRCHLVLDTLKTSVAIAKQKGCQYFVVAGDLFDTTKPIPQMLAAVQKALHREFLASILLLGNHEHASTEPGDHALAPLEPVAQVIEQPTVLNLGNKVNLFCLPCIPGNAEAWFDKELEKLANSVPSLEDVSRILCFHLGVADEETAFYLKGAKDSIGADIVLEAYEKYDFDAVFAGNWHDQRVWDNKIFQLGALAPTGFDNPGLDGYGGLGIFNTSSRKTELIEIPGPRFVTIEQGDDVSELANSEAYIFGRFICAPNDVGLVKEYAQELRDDGFVDEFILRLDKTAQEQAARKAAKEVRKASTLQEALVGFVDKMELPDGLDKQEIVARSGKYISG